MGKQTSKTAIGAFVIGAIALTVISVIVFGYIMINSGFYGWHGGWTFGPRYLVPMLPFLAILMVFSPWNYAWFYLLFGICVWMACSFRKRLRMQFFLSFLFTWIILGTLMAALLSSAGPCYYDRVAGGENPFAELMKYLHSVHQNGSFLYAVHNQERLWEAYETGTRLEFGGGISAMPSLHVAISVLYALLGWRVSRILGALLSFYSLIVLVGSVHLGWHYAVDGYVSILMTIFIWKAVGHGLAVYERRGEREEKIQSET